MLKFDVTDSIMVQAIVEWSTDLGCGVRPEVNLLDTEELKELVSISALESEFHCTCKKRRSVQANHHGFNSCQWSMESI